MENLKRLQRFFIIFCLCLLTLQTSLGQIIYNPTFARRDVPSCDIIKIEKSSSKTVVYFIYHATEYIGGGWVCAGKDFFIRDRNTKITYKLIEANNIPICPQKHNFQYRGQTFEFNLVFPALPSNTTMIDIIEDETEGGFNFYAVILTPSGSTSSNALNQSSVDCDKINYTPSTPKPSFENMLRGVKYVRVNYLWENRYLPQAKASAEYLKEMGFIVNYFDDKRDFGTEEVAFYLQYDIGNRIINNFSMTFLCGGYEWEFSSNKTVSTDFKNGIKNVLISMYQYKKGAFNSYYSIQLPKKQTCWTEAKYREFVFANGCDKIEGIYESTTTSQGEAKYRVAVRKMNGTYYLIYLSGAHNTRDWKEGEIKAELEATATPLFFKAKWLMADKTENDKYYISFETGLMNVIDSDKDKNLYIKMFPSVTDNIGSSSSETTGSGTGWAVSSDGYIATNFHITEGAKSLKVRGINEDFSKTYNAKIIIEDKNNDLAIIKIDDPNFTSFGTIPYVISNKSSDVGTSVFVLGYPLRATMGDEVKLTNGIISSKSGFQGDVTSYQISAPVQPGNSGGPLFDNNGNIIGIINAKHVGTENVSYAVKSSYLLNLIDLISSPPKLQTVSTVTGKDLTEQVKILKKYVYIIEVK